MHISMFVYINIYPVACVGFLAVLRLAADDNTPVGVPAV